MVRFTRCSNKKFHRNPTHDWTFDSVYNKTKSDLQSGIRSIESIKRQQSRGKLNKKNTQTRKLVVLVVLVVIQTAV